MRLFLVLVAAASASLILAVPAAATPVATSMPEYQAYGAVFPDPLAVCQQNCDPNSRGRTNATQFIQFQEYVNALKFMNTNPDWQRYMEVWPLDGHLGAGAGTKAGDDMAPGNNLADLEWKPKPEYQSAGLATASEERQKSDLIVVRVTDENVPDKDKKRYALSLSIHGIERAGAEGGIRAMEQIVTAVSEGRGDLSILPKEVRENAPTFREALANTIIYFTTPNPDGWRRGSIGDTDKGPGVFFQRYNGNGIDPNRDWPDVGFQFRGYSGASEPETRALSSFYHQVRDKFGDFAAGDDLHGQPFADALSYTLMPHGRHDLDKDYRIREASKLINRAQYEATKWDPMIIDNDVENQDCASTIQLGNACAQIYAQTWGSVYDTINYTTTGTLGDWFDSSLGLGADGIDNEMSFSHLDKNINFEPSTEQLHVAGNKAIIFSHIADFLRPPGAEYSTTGKNSYVPNLRLTREKTELDAGPPPGTSPQTDLDDEFPNSADPAAGGSVFEFEVQRDFDTYNGGMRVDVRATNVQGIGSGVATLQVQCKGCDDHVGSDQDEDEWITVAEDFNQGIGYAQAGITAAVNRPDSFKKDGSPVDWRALVSAPGGAPRFSIDFTSGPATTDGATEGDAPPFQAAYDLANTDFFEDLNADANADDDKFATVDPLKVIAGEQSLDGYDTLVLADEGFPGYTGVYKGEKPPPSGPPSKDISSDQFKSQKETTPAQGPSGCVQNDGSTEYFPFAIAANEVNSEARIRITWADNKADYDMYLYADTNGDGVHQADEPEAAPASTSGLPTPTNAETITLSAPAPGSKYVVAVVNCSALPGNPWAGTITFKGVPAVPDSAITTEQKDAWMAKLAVWVAGGGNLVLTDGALRALPELTSLPADAVKQQTVYVGQTSFLVCNTFNAAGTCAETKSTLTDPLAKNVDQPAARFNTGQRRQTFESTPIGYSIQNPETGANQAFARQFDIDLPKLTAAGGRPAGGSASSGAGNAVGVPTRVTLGEFSVGQGKIRFLGGLLPQPSEQYDHPLGLEPYSLTYTGYILFCNLVDCKYERKSRRALPNEPAPPGPVKVGFSATMRTPLLASTSTRNGRKVPVRIKKTGVKRIKRLQVQFRRTGRGTSRKYKKLFPRLKPRTKKIRFKKGKIGETYLLRIRAIGKNGIRSAWKFKRIVFPYDDQGKRRQYSSAWTHVKSKRAWRGGYTSTSTRGATLRFKTRGGGRVYLIGRTGPDGGKAVVRARGGERRVVSFRSKKVRNRRVVAIINRTDKRKLRFRLKVLRGVVTFDALGVRRR